MLNCSLQLPRPDQSGSPLPSKKLEPSFDKSSEDDFLPCLIKEKIREMRKVANNDDDDDDEPIWIKSRAEKCLDALERVERDIQFKSIIAFAVHTLPEIIASLEAFFRGESVGGQDLIDKFVMMFNDDGESCLHIESDDRKDSPAYNDTQAAELYSFLLCEALGHHSATQFQITMQGGATVSMYVSSLYKGAKLAGEMLGACFRVAANVRGVQSVLVDQGNPDDTQELNVHYQEIESYLRLPDAPPTTFSKTTVTVGGGLNSSDKPSQAILHSDAKIEFDRCIFTKEGRGALQSVPGHEGRRHHTYKTTLPMPTDVIAMAMVDGAYESLAIKEVDVSESQLSGLHDLCTAAQARKWVITTKRSKIDEPNHLVLSSITGFDVEHYLTDPNEDVSADEASVDAPASPPPSDVATKNKRTGSFGTMFDLKPGQWRCGTCRTLNEAAAIEKCQSCDKPKLGATPAAAAAAAAEGGAGGSTTNAAAAVGTIGTSGFLFDTSLRAAGSSAKEDAAKNDVFGSDFLDKYKGFDTTAAAADAAAPAPAPAGGFTFGAPAAAAPPTPAAGGFSFGTKKDDTTTTPAAPATGGFSFGTVAPAPAPAAATKTEPAPAFGGPGSASAAPAPAPAPTADGFEGLSFGGATVTPALAAPATDILLQHQKGFPFPSLYTLEGGTWTRITSRPLYKIRFDGSTAHMVIHEDGSLRTLVNHLIDDNTKLELNTKGEHSLVWVAHDYSDNSAVGVVRAFALDFKDHARLFDVFKQKFEEAQAKTSPTSLRAAGSSAPVTSSSSKVAKTTTATENEDTKAGSATAATGRFTTGPAGKEDIAAKDDDTSTSGDSAKKPTSAAGAAPPSDLGVSVKITGGKYAGHSGKIIQWNNARTKAKMRFDPSVTVGGKKKKETAGYIPHHHFEEM